MIIPYRLAFAAEAEGAWWVAEQFIIVFFLVDVALNFFLGFYEDGILVLQPNRIIKNYLKFWFYVDFVASFPVGWFASSDNSLRFLRFFRLCRLTKIARLKKIFFQLEGASTVVFWGPYVVAISRVLLYLTLLAHVGACVWYTVGISSYD